MADCFQTVGDVEATGQDAAELAAVGLSWLVVGGIVAGERNDSCVLGAGPGYPPGPRWTEAVTGSETGSVTVPNGPLERLWTNGMKIHTGRGVFHSSQGEMERAGCPRCGGWVWFVDREKPCDAPPPGIVPGIVQGCSPRHDAAAWAPFDEAIRAWLEGEDGLLACPTCGAAVELNDWRWQPRWAFGHLAFRFWNWPPFRPEFLAEFSRRLGHRVVCVSGKL